MHRTVEHTAFVHRNYDDVCRILERHAEPVFATATAAASRRSTALVAAGDQDLPGFDSSESLLVQIAPLAKDHAHHAWIEFRWEANPRKRLLANVDVRIDIRPLVKRGPSATTELTLRAHYVPDPGTRHSPETALFGRRIVKAALLRLLESFVTSIDDYEESIFA